MKDGLAQDLFEYEKCIEMHNSDQIIPPVLSKGFDPTSPSRFREICHTPLNQKAHIVGLFLGSYSAWNLHNYAFLAPLIFLFCNRASACT